MWLAVLFILVGVFSRLIPHLPNFSPLVAMALFSGVYLNKKNAWLLPLGIFLISDLIIGLHQVIFFTWGSIILIYFLGRYLRKRKSVANTLIFTLAGSFLFFLITNFGVWIMGWYPPNLAGLASCYLNALPFFRTSLISDFVYVVAFFGVYEYFTKKVELAREAA